MKPLHLEESKVAKIWTLTFDLPGEKVNKFSRPVMEAFEALLPELETLGTQGKVDALMVVSGKPGIFIAGADIDLIRAARTVEEARELSRGGQKLLDRWEDLPFPTVVAIEGAALGGGCEFSLASSAIVMSNDPAARIGLPEVLLGVIPGMGGCVRLPRKVGLATSLDMILTGKTLTGDRAAKAGLAEACLPKENFKQSALSWVQKNLAALQAGTRLAKEPKLGGMGGAMGAVMEKTPMGRMVIFKKAREGVLSKSKGHYPAPIEAIETMQATGASYSEKIRGKAREKAMEREAEGFGRVAATDVSKNLIRIFFLTESVKKSKGVASSGSGDIKTQPVRAAAVLGAGVMGGGIAQLFAEKDISTRMKDLTVPALALGVQAAAKIFSKQVSRKRITKRQYLQKLNHIAPVLDFSGFASAQMVVEAVVEKMEIKQAVLKDLEKYVKDDCVIASNTSSLSISKMQEAMAKPERFAGMHFFNPVAKMPLIEVIRGAKSSDHAVSAVYQFSKQLGKTPIVVKDSPGFLVNRLLLPYMNEATFLLAEGVPMDEIDRALLKFGMPMGPIELIDEVGIDVGDKVAHILNDAFGARAETSPVNGKVAGSGRLGKKNGKGFYKYEGRDKSVDTEIYTLIGVTPKPGAVSDEEIVERCILPMINEASRCLEEKVVESADDVDLGMIMGTGFPPFRGGLLTYADNLGIPAIIEKLRKYQPKGGARFEPAPILLERDKKRLKFHEK
jgi:3-hydroxyacyl-CoA dehydrogenase/enoyl-CoA hydratase/3-hydroxybutyryl-CoA epimerase